MTLCVALTGSDGVVLAADSRATIGDPRGLTAINDQQNKMVMLTKFTGLAIAGAADFANSLLFRIREALGEKKELIYADEVANLVHQFSHHAYKEWFGPRPWAATTPIQDLRPPVVFLLAGMQKTDSGLICRIWMLASAFDFVPQLSTTTMMSGIPQYAIYLNHRYYNQKMNASQLCALAVYLITETATQDPKVGGPVHVAIITGENGYTQLDRDAVDGIIKKNDEQSQKLREFFFKDGEQL